MPFQKSRSADSKDDYLQPPTKIHKLGKQQKLEERRRRRERREQQSSRKRSLTLSQLKELKETFAVFDKNKDGVISVQELGIVLRSLGQNPTTAELRDMIQEVDVSGTGTVTFHEFVLMMTHHMKTPQEEEDELMESFQVFDLNNDGYLTTSELRIVLTTLGEQISDRDVEDLVKEADINKDGKIDYNEFIHVMMKKY